jgi:hypothetical protein
MAKKAKPPIRKRLTGTATGILEGPYTTKGALGDKLPRIHEQIWFDPQTKSVVLGDKRTLFDVKPSPTKKLEESATAKRRRELTARAAEIQLKINKNEQLADVARTQQEARTLKREASEMKAKLAEVVAELDRVKTSTDKVDSLAQEQAAVVRQPSSGALQVQMEYDRKSDKVRLYFIGSKVDPNTKQPIDCPPKSRLCYAVAPSVRAALDPYVEPGTKNSGEMGYWAVSSWDYPEVVKKLAMLPNVVLRGAPELDLDKRFKTLDKRAKDVSKGSINFGEKPPRVGSYKDGTPAPFQEEGVRFLMSRDQAILADDMGLGKTYQAIIAAHNAVPKSQQILIICPAAMVGSWARDISVFMPSAAVSILNTASFNKGDAPSERPEKARFLITSYQGATSLTGKAKVANLLLDRRWGLVILDEAHRLKHFNTLLHRFIDKIKADRFWFLTGTPMANHVVDYYGLLKLAKHPAGRRLDEFRKKYLPREIKSGKATVSVDRKPLLALGQALTGFVLRRTKEEVLSRDLPKKVGGIAQAPAGFIEATLPREVLADIAETVEEGGNREKVRHALAVAKAPTTWEIAENMIDAGDKVVLFTTYTDVLHGFAELCQHKKVLYIVISGEVSTVGKSAQVNLFQGEPLSDQEEKWAKNNLGQWWLNLVRYVPTDEWNKADLAEARKRFGKDEAEWPHKIQVVLAQMVAASEGVTLTQADTLLFNDLDYMPSRHQQAEDRIYRLSKGGKLPHNSVYIGYVYANDPMGIDQNILLNLKSKMADINDVYRGTGKDTEGAAEKTRSTYLKDVASITPARRKARRR